MVIVTQFIYFLVNLSEWYVVISQLHTQYYARTSSQIARRVWLSRSLNLNSELTQLNVRGWEKKIMISESDVNQNLTTADRIPDDI